MRRSTTVIWGPAAMLMAFVTILLGAPATAQTAATLTA